MPDSPVSDDAFAAAVELRDRHGEAAFDRARWEMSSADARDDEGAMRLWAEVCFLFICRDRLAAAADRS